MANRHCILLPFSWELPTPGLWNKTGIFGNNINADGVRRGWQVSLMLPSRSFCLQIFREPFPIQDSQLVQHLVPVPVSLCPFLRYILACQIQHLFQGCVAWKYTLCLGHFPVLAVQPLSGVVILVESRKPHRISRKA